MAGRESVDRLTDILELSSEWYWEQDRELRFIAITGAIADNAGVPVAEILGKCRWDGGTAPVAARWEEHVATLKAHRPFRDFLYSRTDDRGEARYILASGKPVFDANGVFGGYRGVAKDVSETVLGEKLLRLEHTVTRCIAEADSFLAAIEAVIRAICRSEGWECGDYWRFDEPAGLRRLLHSWGVDAPQIQRFIGQSRGLVLPFAAGNVGTVLKSGKPVWKADMTSDTQGARAKIAREAGLKALFILPITAGASVLGAISFNTRKFREPDERFLQAARVIGDQVGQFLQRKHAEDVLRESEERFRSLTELSSDMYFEQDEEHRITSMVGIGPSGMNGRRQQLLGKKRWEHEYTNMTSEGWAAHRACLDAHEPFRDLELCRIEADGSKVWVSVSATPLLDATGRFTGYRGVGKDITARKLAEERVQYLAHHDGLTGLPNRLMFGELLNLAIQHARRYHRRFAVLFIDLDRFKIINDTLGHEAGDRLLKEMAGRLRETLRTSDIVARLGGDEFVVLAHEVDEPGDVGAVARKLLSSLIRPVTISGQECRVTASIGICRFPADAQDEQALMKNADLAMYQAKEQGKNNYQFYSDKLNVHSFERLALETSLRRALEREEFLLHYQAKLDLKSGAITGVEALVRWQHPDLGMVSPAQFIPLAEETGLIVPLGRWVLKTACEQNMAWQRQGLPQLHMAVNLSARQFADERLLEDVKQTLEESGLAPELLELEITESMVMQDVERTAKVLAAIKELGVRLAIDDFGVGYSSLATLKRFPIDILKVDRSFIRDIPGDSDDKALTEAIIAMGKTLSLTVVAEGVETREQQAFLQKHACDEMQGFYFSRPIPHLEFAEFLRKHVATVP